ncbi:sulfite exporter TauE/SafE family protein 1-like [Typha latifolia]|uniref:sulfite exporter TauE/SafE family protein 1-like n=1 Tax=Typha latifolia TaxID=4733 RepID=UPI003C309CC8
MSESHVLDLLLNQFAYWRQHQMELQQSNLTISYHTIVAWVLCFIAASASSAGGLGGGSLYLLILNIFAGLSLKKATSFTAFMVTGGSLSSVLYILFLMNPSHKGESLVNFEIALLSQPCMLLGVSVGVVCNVMFPEWLITVLFTVFLACSTYKTCKAGFKCWKAESEVVRDGMDRREGGEKGVHEPLLGGEGGSRLRVPWKDLVVLVMVWVCFFMLHVFIGDKHGKGLVRIKPCGVAYWLITLSQIPFAIAFTAYIIYVKKNPQSQNDQQANDKTIVGRNKKKPVPVFVFPLAALLTGVMSGLFGIGGGLLLNPALLQIGVPPQTAAATSTFMVLFSSSMSMVQYIILGMKGIDEALIYAMICFVASVVGLAIVERAIQMSGRVSLIIFIVSAVMAFSTVTQTCFGAVDVWRQYASGDYMGFKLPC